MQRPADLFTPFASAAISLAVAVNLCAGIVVIGFFVDRYTHARHEQVNTRVPRDGLWFCLGGTFGNGCWD